MHRDVINITQYGNDITPTPNSILTTQPYAVVVSGNQYVTFLINSTSTVDLSTNVSNLLKFTQPSSGNFPITFYPVQIGGTSPTVNQILTALNVAPYNSVVIGTAVSDPSLVTPGTGTIVKSTDAEYAFGTSMVDFYTFTDGINYVSSSDLLITPNTLTLKNPVSPY